MPIQAAFGLVSSQPSWLVKNLRPIPDVVQDDIATRKGGGLIICVYSVVPNGSHRIRCCQSWPITGAEHSHGPNPPVRFRPGAFPARRTLALSTVGQLLGAGMAAVIEMEYTGAHETPTKPIILLFAHHYVDILLTISGGGIGITSR